MSNKHEFEFGEVAYIVERDFDGEPMNVVCWLLFVAQVGHVAIVKNNCANETYTDEELLRSLVIDTVNDEPDIFAYPIKDCYHTYEEAQRAIDVYHFRRNHDEL